MCSTLILHCSTLRILGLTVSSVSVLYQQGPRHNIPSHIKLSTNCTHLGSIRRNKYSLLIDSPSSISGFAITVSVRVQLPWNYIGTPYSTTPHLQTNRSVFVHAFHIRRRRGICTTYFHRWYVCCFTSVWSIELYPHRQQKILVRQAGVNLGCRHC